MSHIFDALQRSEAESAGIDPAALAEATELLQRAERRAVSQWESSLLVDKLEARPARERGPSYGYAEFASPAALADRDPGPAAYAPVDDRRETRGEYRSLPIILSSDRHLPCLSHNESAAAEAIRLLGVRLRHMRRDRQLRKVLITSTIPQEGKSMVSSNLACSLAQQTNQRTLLLEGDLRRPSLSQIFGLGRNSGLCEWLQGERSLTSCIYHLEGAGIWMMPSGSAPSNALELLQSDKLSSLMDQLTERFDWIIIDSPPIMPLADTSVWSRLADGILLVAREGVTERPQLLRGLEALDRKKILGAALNCANDSAESDYYYRRPAASAGQNN
jgi:capsular exopolysaccharide synthesis family protein